MGHAPPTARGAGRRECSAGALDVTRRGRARASDCVRQYRQPAAGPLWRAATGTRDPDRDWREPRADSEAAPDRESTAGCDRRRSRGCDRGGLAIAIAAVGIDLLRAHGPATLPRLQEVRLDPRVAAFTAVTSL